VPLDSDHGQSPFPHFPIRTASRPPVPTPIEQALTHMEQAILEQLRTVTKELKGLTSDFTKAKAKGRS
jgi:hypothetical protein